MTRNPKTVFLALVAFTIVCFALAGLIGQHNDGPWGGLPEWLGSASWIGFLLGVLGVVLTGLYLLVTTLGRRRATESGSHTH